MTYKVFNEPPHVKKKKKLIRKKYVLSEMFAFAEKKSIRPNANISLLSTRYQNIYLTTCYNPLVYIHFVQNQTLIYIQLFA